MRYYYTDPLKVAYMAREFGIYTEQGSKETGDYIINDPASFFHYLKEELPISINTMEERRYYIHPDSCELLKPQVGDLVESLEFGYIDTIVSMESYYDHCIREYGEGYNDEWSTPEENVQKTELDKTIISAQVADEDELMFWESLSGEYNRIIERNGKTFFVPQESES